MWEYTRQCNLILIDKGETRYLGYCNALSAQEAAESWLNTGEMWNGRVWTGSKKAKPLKTYMDKPFLDAEKVAKKLSVNKRYIFVSYVNNELDTIGCVFEV